MSRWMQMFRDSASQGGAGAIGTNGINGTGIELKNHPQKDTVEDLSRRVHANAVNANSANSCSIAIPHVWQNGVARLLGMPPPDRVPTTRWRRLQADATRFLDVWGEKAAALGWSSADLFGANRVRPFIRVDAAGLVRLLDDRPVVAMTDHEAVIRCRTGARQAFRPKSANAFRPGERVLLWELSEKDLCLGPEAAR